MKPSTLELFAAFVTQIPLLTREDLEVTVSHLRENPGWARALLHARTQALAIGLSPDRLDEPPAGADMKVQIRSVLASRTATPEARLPDATFVRRSAV